MSGHLEIVAASSRSGNPAAEPLMKDGRVELEAELHAANAPVAPAQVAGKRL